MDHRAIEEARFINSTQHKGTENSINHTNSSHNQHLSWISIFTMFYKVLKYVGNVISPEMQTPKLLWIKRHLPNTWYKFTIFAFKWILCETVCVFVYYLWICEFNLILSLNFDFFMKMTQYCVPFKGKMQQNLWIFLIFWVIVPQVTSISSLFHSEIHLLINNFHYNNQIILQVWTFVRCVV
jgi:hypothetical protein